MDNLLYWVWLASTPGLGSRKISRLLQAFGSPKGVWKASEAELRSVAGLSHQNVFQLCKKDMEAADQIINKAKKSGIRIITIQDAEYPENLRNIYDPPHVLYVVGQPFQQEDIMISVVGSRMASPYGKSIAEKISFELAQRGIIIVSGMARGIDTYAHKGALKAGKRTVAVLGCGVDIVYPKENRELMKYISKHGAIISEYPPGTYPNPGNFPARNRIISGLSYGTVVIEAGEKSGSLITADCALEQGREVFAVPGNIDGKYSIGTNNLIKQGAKLVNSEMDILDELPQHILRRIINKSTCINPSELNQPIDGLSVEEQQVINALSDIPMHIDLLFRKLGLNMQTLSATLTILEMKGLVRQIPGKFFIRG